MFAIIALFRSRCNLASVTTGPFCDERGKAQEDRATAISGAFLLPAADLRRELGTRRSGITRDMTYVAKEYGVSMMLLAKHANLCGIVGDSAYKSFCIVASKAGWRKKEPSQIGPEEPMLFQQLVYRAVCEDDISIQRGAELLGVSFDEVANQCAPLDAAAYEQRLGEALKESRRDFEEGRFYASRDEMLEAVAKKRMRSS